MPDRGVPEPGERRWDYLWNPIRSDLDPPGLPQAVLCGFKPGVMLDAQKHKIVQRRRATAGPRHDVVRLAAHRPHIAPGHDATTIPQFEGSAEFGAHQPPLLAEIEDHRFATHHDRQDPSVAAQPTQVAGRERLDAVEEPSTRRLLT